MGTQCKEIQFASLQNLQRHKRDAKLCRSKDSEAFFEAKLVTFQTRLLEICGVNCNP